MNEARKGGLTPRLTLLAIVLVFIAPLLGAWILYEFTDYGRGGKVASHGQLLQPARALPDLALYSPVAGGPRERLHGKWTLLMLNGPECAGHCMDHLYRMRQIRLAMGENVHRVQRLLVVYGAEVGPFSERLRDTYMGQLYLSGEALDPGDPGASVRLSPGEDPIAAGRLYLVDPLGNLMMSYGSDAQPEGIIKDLRRLLRYSRIG
ncbi:MAG: hypothetical protein HYY48_02005 [Gammaproteobacteria bacterium]|nr:hypothetical protein [Gammaproteobacteria bacterium]